jgi:selT/selW/selH selenoprotein domain
LKLHAEGRQFGDQNSRARRAHQLAYADSSSGGAFEIRANGKLLHSKLESGEWPDFDEIVKAIKKAK